MLVRTKDVTRYPSKKFRAKVTIEDGWSKRWISEEGCFNTIEELEDFYNIFAYYKQPEMAEQLEAWFGSGYYEYQQIELFEDAEDLKTYKLESIKG